MSWPERAGRPEGGGSAIERLAAALMDRYRIERELGQGGLAPVYLAQDLRHQRKVALKVLRPELAAVIVDHRRVRTRADDQFRGRIHFLGLTATQVVQDDGSMSHP